MFNPTATYCLFPVMEGRRSSTAGRAERRPATNLALSLALLGTPRCLMLDEPSIGLAPNLVERMFDRLRTLSRDHGLPNPLVHTKAKRQES
jgi:branched-chain amino acid transport system ATP-binding protein